MRKRLIKPVLIAFALSAMLLPQHVVGAEDNSLLGGYAGNEATRYWGPYCGVAALYFAGRYEEFPVEWKDLSRPEFISSRKGSTLSDLSDAARGIGFKATSAENLTITHLRSLNRPTILHVRQDLRSPDYEHYVLCLWVDGDTARIVDLPAPPVDVPVEQVAAFWNGKALVLDSGSNAAGGILARWQWAGLLGLAGVGIFVGSILTSGDGGARPAPGKWLRRDLTGVAALAAVAVVVGLLYHSSSGLFTHAAAADQVKAAYAFTFVPRVSASEMGSRQKNGAIIIDARRDWDFAAGHVPGSINIPPGLGIDEIRRLLGDAAAEQEIVIYCESEGCPFSDFLASRLWSMGYRHLAISPGGWREWKGERS